MTGSDDLFAGFATERRAANGVDIHCRIGGEGPLLVLLHGYPQSHVMWHRIAPALAEHFTCVIPDLRGYGESEAPRGGGDHAAYSKRTMGSDVVALMAELGHDRFRIAGHDRGGRVAYRLAFDHPDRVERVAVLDILPTYEYWQRMNMAYGLTMYHWLFLAQPEPLPEMLISAEPERYLDHTIASWTKAKDLSAFDSRALAHYRRLFTDPARVHAACEDYRAGAGIDMDLDTADIEAGRRIAVPLYAIWGGGGLAPAGPSPLDVWRRWAENVEGTAVDAGHFVAEEAPDETLAALLPFLKGEV